MGSFIKDVFKTLRVMARLVGRHFGDLLLAALIPFLSSHLVVLQARQIGMPYRLGLDFVHGLLVLSYLCAVVQMKFHGASKFGFAFLKPRWLGLRPLMLAAVAVGLVGYPLALVLHPLTQTLESIALNRGGLWSFIPTVMFPEYLMTTLVGLALVSLSSPLAGHGKETDAHVC